jgi:hypothetical protein
MFGTCIDSIERFSMKMPQTNLVNSFEREWLVSTFITFLILSSPGAGLACCRLLFKDLRTPPIAPQRYRPGRWGEPQLASCTR